MVVLGGGWGVGGWGVGGGAGLHRNNRENKWISCSTAGHSPKKKVASSCAQVQRKAVKVEQMQEGTREFVDVVEFVLKKFARYES